MGCCLFDCIGGTILTIFRWALFVFNVLFVISGISLITTGAIFLINIGNVDDFVSDQAELGAIILISTGAVTFIIAFLGCCGAIKRSPWMMNLYAGLLFALFATQLAGGIIAFVYQDEVEVGFRNTLISTAKEYYIEGEGGEEIAKNSWDKLQSEQLCCGVDSFEDWLTYRPELMPERFTPDSCKCTAEQEGCDPNLFVFTQGCYTKLQPYLRDMVLSFAGIGLGTAILELVAGIFSLCLANRFSDKKRKRSNSS